MPFQRPRLIIVVATLLFVALTVRLGLWQLDRGQQKAALVARQAQLDREPVAPWRGEVGEAVWQRRVQVQGRWYGAGQILLDNRIRDEAVGYDVLTPLLLPDGRLLPVMRGWLPRQGTDVAQVAIPTGDVTLTVRLVSPEQHYVELSHDTVTGRIWQNLDWARYRALVKPTVVAALAYQLEGPDGLARHEPISSMGPERHYLYAGQWFLFAALAAVLFLVLHWKRAPR